jgi:hypothetical protein
MKSFLSHLAIDGRLIAAGLVTVAVALVVVARSRMHRATRAVFSVFDLSVSCISGRHGRCDADDTRCPCKCHPRAIVRANGQESVLAARH